MKYWCDEDGYRRKEIDTMANVMYEWIGSNNIKAIYPSMVQRVLLIGVNKANRVLECLEQRGEIEFDSEARVYSVK